MIELALVGIASGDPAQLTAEAVRHLEDADLILVPRKGAEKAELAEVRRRLCAGLRLRAGARTVEFDLPRRAEDGPDYLGGVAEWHMAIARTWADLLARHLPDQGRAAFMVWGDPSLYDSSLRIAGHLRARGLPLSVRVVPGISSLQLLAAAFAIPLNTLGAPFLVTTGRRLRDGGWPEGVDTVAVMLDGGCAFQALDPKGIHIYWGAYLGMEGALLRSGPLASAGPDIVATRTAARAARGWIMDVYLLRREAP